MPGTNITKKAAAAKAASKPTYGLGLTTKGFDLDLPSGNKCLAIRPGAQGLIKAGLLDSMDQLTALVQTEHIDGKDSRKLAEAVKALTMDMDKVKEGLEMVDRCIAHVVQQPKVWLDEYEGDGVTPKPRRDDRIYADQVDLEDKMFIFNWAMGGTADLKIFREQSAELLGGISAS